ncbi:MAG: GatB/YqeY domain-containing protein [Armatimonadota bacterium]|nr:GatB/YqeY domain-containing protein [Armatimonadota bacterium]MCX7777516.1 GatB/YqeY domain-containing protein [Armatimonadota bacterium]MDW8025992.1 GatB/YqeY domain-containing protein [Armatimonadota bacterium]
MLRERLMEDYKEALRQRDALKVSTLRMLRAAIHNAEIDKGGELSDEEIIKVVQSEVRKEKEALEAFERGGRDDLAWETRKRIEILEGYLPRMLSESEIREAASKVIVEVGALSPKDIGKVMSKLMPQLKGRADGSLVSKIVRELLEAKLSGSAE